MMMRPALLLWIVLLPPLAAQWTELSNTAITTAICPANGASGSVNFQNDPYLYQSACPAITRAWSGGVARAKAGSEQLFVIGGGHGDGADNSLYRLNLAVTPPVIGRVTNPSQVTFADWDNNVAMLADGKPSARHTYDWMTYIPGADRIFMFGGSIYGDLGSNPKDGWLLNPDTFQWYPITAAAGGFDPQGGALLYPNGSATYDAATNRVWLSSAGNFFTLDLDTCSAVGAGYTCTYTYRSGAGAQLVAGARSVIDATRHRIFYLGGGSAYTVPIGSGYVTVDITSSVDSSCSTLMNSEGPGLFYDAQRDTFVGWPLNGDGTIYTMHPTTYVCATHAYSGGPPDGSATNGLWGRGSYFPSLGKFAVINDFGINAFTLNYSGLFQSSSSSGSTFRGSMRMK